MLYIQFPLSIYQFINLSIYQFINLSMKKVKRHLSQLDKTIPIIDVLIQLLGYMLNKFD
jgi:hypothetical protein